jgi:ribosomal-protein-alanine N-acetyltransferase
VLHRTAEIAYDFAPRAHGRGIASACCRAVSDWALAVHGFVRVQATALDSNAASIRVLEKSGFAFEGRLRNLKMVRGTPRDFLLYARTS